MRTLILVDLDNTVMRNPFESAIFPYVLQRFSAASGLAPQEVRDAIDAEFFRRVRPASGLPPESVFDWDDIISTVAAPLGISDVPSVLQLVNQYACPPYIRVLDEADEVLRKVRRPWRRLVAATNGLSKYQVPVLEALGLADLFDDLVTPDIASALKGSPAFYENIRTPGECDISVGDSYTQDVIEPKNLGMWTIWVRHGPTVYAPEMPHTPTAADFVVQHLREVPALIDRIESVGAGG